MRQILINQFEKVASQDVNNLQLFQAKALQDDFIFNFFGGVSNGVLGSSFACSYVSQFAFSLLAGAGYFYDSSQAGANPNFRTIQSSANISGLILANTNANNRIDLVCLAPNFVVTSSATRYVKTGGVGPIIATVVNKTLADSYTLQVVAGTPSGSPAVPATPAGYIPIAHILNLGSSGGMSGSGAVTDARNVLTLAVSNAGHNIATGTTLQSQLDAVDAALSLDSKLSQATVVTNTAINSTTGFIRSNSTSGNLTHTLPQGSTLSVNKTITIKDVGTGGNSTTVQGFGGSDLIDGVNIYATTLKQFENLTVRWNGSSWDTMN